jgi:hypothetical protein
MPPSPTLAAESFPAVGLAELETSAGLQDRVDSKYVISLADFATLAERLLGTHAVLEIDDRRAFRYRTTYFDTRELQIFRDHVQERRRRYKCRAREYVDSGLCMFEVKLKGPRGRGTPVASTGGLGGPVRRLTEQRSDDSALRLGPLESAL